MLKHNLSSFTPGTTQFIASEANGTMSREKVTLAADCGYLAPGTVLGINSDGNYAPYDDTANDGTETAVGILFNAATNSSADQPVTIITRLCEVYVAMLQWAPANDATAKANGLADLAARYIIAR